MNLKRALTQQAAIKWFVPIVVIFILSGSFLVWRVIDSKSSEHIDVVANRPAVFAAAPKDSDQKPTAGGTTAHPYKVMDKIEKYESFSPSSSDLENQLADSPEEAEWLQEHGYPSLDDLEYMGSLSLDQLTALARAGNQMAQVFLGTRLALVDRNFERGVRTLESAAASGSVYALTALASVHEASGNLALAQGYRIASLLRGDYETVFVHNITNSFSNAAAPQWELTLGFLAGQAIIDRLNQARIASGIGVLPPPTPRPGAEVAYQHALQELQRMANEGAKDSDVGSNKSPIGR